MRNNFYITFIVFGWLLLYFQIDKILFLDKKLAIQN